MGNSNSKNGGSTYTATNVGCDVLNCKFNNIVGGYCTAPHIDVQNKSALNKGETYCNTFYPKGSM